MPVSLATSKTPPASIVAQLLGVLPAHTTLQIITSPASLATIPCLELSAQITKLASVLLPITNRLQHAKPALLAVFPALLMVSTPFAAIAILLCREAWVLPILHAIAQPAVTNQPIFLASTARLTVAPAPQAHSVPLVR